MRRICLCRTFYGCMGMYFVLLLNFKNKHMFSNYKCHPSKNCNEARSASVLSTFLLIILPKCPFCIMAYSSAITICGGPDMYFISNNWVSYVPLFLALFINLMLLLNWRGQRTILAIIVGYFTKNIISTIFIGLTSYWFLIFIIGY